MPKTRRDENIYPKPTAADKRRWAINRAVEQAKAETRQQMEQEFKTRRRDAGLEALKTMTQLCSALAQTLAQLNDAMRLG